MLDVNMWGVVFVFAAILVAVVLGYVLSNVWLRFHRETELAIARQSQRPSWLRPMLLTVVGLGLYLIVLPTGWQVMVLNTTTRSDYQLPTQVQEQKKVLESTVPIDEELDQARAKQKQRQQTDPHKEALGAFDKAMEAEAKTIKERSGK